MNSPLSLYVLRHAKAEADAPGGDDAKRELKRRGRRAAAEIGAFLSRLGEAPELVLTSSAVRARDTAHQALDSGGWTAPLDTRPGFYLATSETLLAALASLDTPATRVLLVGHQPALAQLIAVLTGSEPEFPTAALARVDLDVERWTELAPRRGRLVWLVTPDVIAAGRAPIRE